MRCIFVPADGFTFKNASSICMTVYGIFRRIYYHQIQLIRTPSFSARHYIDKQEEGGYKTRKDFASAIKCNRNGNFALICYRETGLLNKISRKLYTARQRRIHFYYPRTLWLSGLKDWCKHIFSQVFRNKISKKLQLFVLKVWIIVPIPFSYRNFKQIK